MQEKAAPATSKSEIPCLQLPFLLLKLGQKSEEVVSTSCCCFSSCWSNYPIYAACQYCSYNSFGSWPRISKEGHNRLQVISQLGATVLTSTPTVRSSDNYQQGDHFQREAQIDLHNKKKAPCKRISSSSHKI